MLMVDLYAFFWLICGLGLLHFDGMIMVLGYVCDLNWGLGFMKGLNLFSCLCMIFICKFLFVIL